MTIPRAPVQSDRYASAEEVALAFAALGDADFARLGQIARLRARGLVSLDWRDLLHDAVQRSLDGTRRWPTNVPFLIFLREVIRSLASEAWRRQSAHQQRTRDLDAIENPDVLAIQPEIPVDPEYIVGVRDLVETVEKLFEGDLVARHVLHGIAEGLTPEEIRHRAGIGSTEYESVRRRIRRKIASMPVEIFL